MKVGGGRRYHEGVQSCPFDVELIFSPPRRILAQLTEAVSVKAVCAMLANAWRFTKKEKEEERFIQYQISPRSRKRRTKPDLWPIS